MQILLHPTKQKKYKTTTYYHKTTQYVTEQKIPITSWETYLSSISKGNEIKAISKKEKYDTCNESKNQEPATQIKGAKPI